MEANTLDLFYWPTRKFPSPTTLTSIVESILISIVVAAPTDISTSFVSNGVTFISPSVYVGFTSLSAYDYCGTVGTAMQNVTLGFDVSELSTAVVTTALTTRTATDTNGVPTSTYIITNYFLIHGGRALHLHDLQQNCSTIQGYTYVAGNPAAGSVATSKSSILNAIYISSLRLGHVVTSSNKFPSERSMPSYHHPARTRKVPPTCLAGLRFRPYRRILRPPFSLVQCNSLAPFDYSPPRYGHHWSSPSTSAISDCCSSNHGCGSGKQW